MFRGWRFDLTTAIMLTLAITLTLTAATNDTQDDRQAASPAQMATATAAAEAGTQDSEAAPETATDPAASLILEGDIVREPASGILTIPEASLTEDEDEDGEETAATPKAEHHLKCSLPEGNELVSDTQWYRLDMSEEEEDWERLEDESGASLDVGAIFAGNKYTKEGRFRCQIGTENKADFLVYLGNRTAASRTQYKVKKFKKSYDVDQGEDFIIECAVATHLGDLEAIVKDLDYRWFKWSKSNDMTFAPKLADDEKAVKPNCSVLNEDSSVAASDSAAGGLGAWLEIKGNEMIQGELEPHITLLNTNKNTIKIEDARWEDRRGYKCIAFNRTDTSVCSESAFFVRVKDKYAAVWPFIGIVAEVVVLVLIIFVCEKRKANKDGGDGSIDDEEEYNGNAVAAGRGGNSAAVRQRRS